MALPDYIDEVVGTPIVWTSSGGNKGLTFTSVAAGAARQGAKSDSLVDATYGMPMRLEILVESKVAVAVTSVSLIELYVGRSSSATAGTDNPGNLSGTDASLSDPSQWTRQLDRVGALMITPAGTTNVQKQWMSYVPKLPYLSPVLYNQTNQAASATGTDTKVTVYPIYSRIKD